MVMRMSDDDYTVRLIDMEVTVPGVCVLDAEGWPNIYINARLSRDGQKNALDHELRHLRDDDHYNSADIREIERMT